MCTAKQQIISKFLHDSVLPGSTKKSHNELLFCNNNKALDPGVTPELRVFYPDLGVGCNQEQTELWDETWTGGDTPSSVTLVMSFRGGFIK